MTTQIHLTLKSSTAKLAGEGLETRVLAGVRYQVAALGEGLAADLAFVRLFTWKQKGKGVC